MNKLSKEQIAKKEELHGKLKAALQRLTDAVTDTNTTLSEKFGELRDNLRSDAIEDFIEAFNDARSEGVGDIERLQSEFNEIITEEVHPFMSDIASAMQEYFDSKSEKWQEGEAGEAYLEWVSAWENELEESELTLPETDLELKDLIGVNIDDLEPEEIDDPEESGIDVDVVEEFGNLPNSPGDV